MTKNNSIAIEPIEEPGRSIEEIHVISSGSGEQHKEHRYGSALPQLWWVLTSQSWIQIPINYFLIRHTNGLILFDTGIDPAIITDSNYISSAIGRFLLRRIFRLHVSADDWLRNRISELGYRAADIRKAIISHLHFDHVGGIADIPQAKLLVSEREWAQLSEPHPEYEWILAEHIQIPGANWQPFQFSSSDNPLFSPFGGYYDVMGDGSLVLLPTPGHTPGSVSMLIRSKGEPPVLLVADLAYDCESIFSDRVPDTGNPEVLRKSFANVRALKQQLPDLIIVASHDPAASELLRDYAANTPV